MDQLNSVLPAILSHFHPIGILYKADYIYVNAEDIIHIEARNNNCLVHLAIKPTIISISSNISTVEQLLPADLFVRIHRSYIINV